MATNLLTIVRATRRSARAIERMQRLTCRLREARDTERATLLQQHARAHRAYQRAQAALAANPLPGDRAR
jgi:hypothetical protein